MYPAQNRHVFVLSAIFTVFFLPPMAWTQVKPPNRELSIADVLQIARQNAVEPLAYQAEQKAYEADALAMNRVFDSKLTAMWQKSHDDGPLNQLTHGEERRQDRLETSYQVLLPSGTSVEVSASWMKQGLKFPFPIGSIDPINAPRYNPEHETLVGVAVRQSLWRNWMTKEIQQAREVMAGKAIEPQFQALSQLQDVQGEAEHLYWQLVGINEQVAVAEQLVKISKSFAKSMERRRNIGRSDDVDVADADSLVLAREADLLNLVVQQNQLQERLRIRLFGHDPLQRLRVPARLPRNPPLALSVQRAPQAMELAKKNRFDLRMLEKQRELSDKQVELAKEQALPDIGLFVSYHRRGLADELNQSLEDLDGGSIASIGMDLNWTLGSTEKKEQTRAAQLRKQSLDYHGQMLSRMVKQNLNAAFERMDGAKRQRQLAETHIQVLRAKKAAEERKLRQARSDELAVQRYEIEVLSAEMQRIDAHLRLLLAIADIRTLTHAYPSEAAQAPKSRG
ncbi:MAG: TolC family protein [Oligoflexus sp.]